MNPKLIIGILFGGIILLLLAQPFLSPTHKPVQPARDLPWQIEIRENGSLRVFGLTLGKTTLGEARVKLGQEGAVGLFISPEDELSVEAYFERVVLNGLKAKMVLRLEPGEEATKEMGERGLRIKRLDSGARRISLHPDDLTNLASAPVRWITYIPSANLDGELIRRRFGEPTERIPEGEGITHWLYPHLGLDITLNREGKEVLQYLAPKDFRLILEPLQFKSQK